MIARLRGNAPVILLILTRIGAGMVGVLPPLIAIMILDRTDYGKAAADIAIALILCGPIVQYIGRGYLHESLKARSHGGQMSWPGAAMIHAWGYVAILLASLAGALGWLSLRDTALIVAFIPPYLASRLLECRLIAAGRQQAAILLVYVIAPVTSAALMVGLAYSGFLGTFAAVAVAQVVGVVAGIALGIRLDAGFLRLLAPPPLPRTARAWRAEIGAVAQYVTNGALLIAGEQVPVVALRLFGLSAMVPSYELARKVASLPAVMIHGLSMHLVTRMVDAVETGRLDELRRLVRSSTLVMASFGAFYGLCVSLAVMLGHHFGIGADVLPMHILAPLLLATFVITIGTGCGPASLALQGERWWIIGASIGFALQIAVIVGFGGWVGAPAMAWGWFVLMLAFHGTVMLGVLSTLWRSSDHTGKPGLESLTGRLASGAAAFRARHPH